MRQQFKSSGMDGGYSGNSWRPMSSGSLGISLEFSLELASRLAPSLVISILALAGFSMVSLAFTTSLCTWYIYLGVGWTV